MRKKQTNNRSGVNGVHRTTYTMEQYDPRYDCWYTRTVDCWVATWVEDGQRKDRKFSVREHGCEEARRLAIKYREMMDD